MTAPLMEARSALFVPGTRPERFAKAMSSGADAVILDLEDAVAPESKRDARSHVLAWASSNRDVAVRVNDLDSPWGLEDLHQVAGTGVAVMVPKASPDSLSRTRDLLPDTPIVALVETPASMIDLPSVCAAAGDPSLLRLAFGGVDYAADLGLPRPEGPVLDDARIRLVLASAAARLPMAPLDGVCLALDDPFQFSAAAQAGRSMGMGGQLAIHPRQVHSINAAYMPTNDEIAWARAVAAAAASGEVTSVNGEMVDLPVIKRARRLLQQTQRNTPNQNNPSPHGAVPAVEATTGNPLSYERNPA